MCKYRDNCPSFILISCVCLTQGWQYIISNSRKFHYSSWYIFEIDTFYCISQSLQQFWKQPRFSFQQSSIFFSPSHFGFISPFNFRTWSLRASSYWKYNEILIQLIINQTYIVEFVTYFVRNLLIQFMLVKKIITSFFVALGVFFLQWSNYLNIINLKKKPIILPIHMDWSLDISWYNRRTWSPSLCLHIYSQTLREQFFLHPDHHSLLLVK